MAEKKHEPSTHDHTEQNHTPDSEDQTPLDQGKLRGADSNRSARSIEKGGQNEQQGEPAPGYGTVAPGMQGGGQKR